MTEKKQSLEPGTVEWEEERIRLSEAVKKAQQDLWDHRNPIIEDPQLKAQQEWKESQKAAASKAASKETK